MDVVYYRFDFVKNHLETGVNIYILGPNDCEESFLGLYADEKHSLLFIMNAYSNSQKLSEELMIEESNKRKKVYSENKIPHFEAIKASIAVGYDKSIVVVDILPEKHLYDFLAVLEEKEIIGLPKNIVPGFFNCVVVYKQYFHPLYINEQDWHYEIKTWKRVKQYR